MVEKSEMSQLTRNITANFLSRTWGILISLAFLPLYIHFMGIESYGLVGLFGTLSSISGLLDLGLSSTMNREMARYSAYPDKAQEASDLVRTLEVGYWAIGAAIGILVVVLAPMIAHSWLNINRLAPETVRQTIMIMGFALALQWPISFYDGGLMGLQRQVLSSSLNSGIATLRSVGAVLILWLVSPTIQAFFSWQILISTVHTGLTAFFLWHSLPKTGHKPHIRRERLLSVWRFSAGVSAISVLSLILTQFDKIVLSKLLSLEMFGYYTLAGVVANSLFSLVGPVFSAVLPGFSKLVAINDQDTLKRFYHRSCQLMSVSILPAAIVLVLFAPEILLLWTRNPTTVENTHQLVRLLLVGTALNGLMHLPYGLQLAYGWTKLTFYTNGIAVLVLVPVGIFMTLRYGAVGMAAIWVVLNSGYILINLQIMHRRLLPGEQWKWYWNDVGVPLIAALLPAGFVRLLITGTLSQGTALVSLVCVSAAALSASVLATKSTRKWLLQGIQKAKVSYGA